MSEVPVRKKIMFYETNCIQCFKYANQDFINLDLEDCTLDGNVISILRERSNVPVILMFNGSTEKLNQLFRQLSYFNISNPIEIRFGNKVKVNKNDALEISSLRNNVKIAIVSEAVYDPTELNNWCLNLSDEEFKIVYDKIAVKRQALELLEEREIARSVYLRLSKKIDFNSMTDTSKMNFMYDWVLNHSSYDYDLIQADGNFKDDVDRTLGSDPCKVFKRGKGVCTGRSRLLKILLNNPYMRVNCYTAHGLCGHLEHEWNEFIDENGRVFAYDISYKLKHVDDITKCNKGHHNIVHNHVVESSINGGQFAPSSLSPRRNSSSQQAISPLPPRRNSSLQKAIPPLPPRKH